MAQYKTETADSKSIGWVATNGKTVHLTIALQRMLWDYFGDGEWTSAPGQSGQWSVSYTLLVDGVEHNACGGTTEIQHPDVVAKIGKVGLNAERYAAVKAMIADLNANPAMLAQQGQADQAMRAEREYRAHTRKINNAMTLNGGTY